MYRLKSVVCGFVMLLLAGSLSSAWAKKAEADVSAISLDVLRIDACARGKGCVAASGPMQLNLLDLADGKVDFASKVLLPAQTKELRLVLGDNSTITVEDESFPLDVPSGKTSGLKLKGQKVFGKAGGFLSGLTLRLDLKKQLVVQAKKVKAKGHGKGKKKSGVEEVLYSFKLKPIVAVKTADVEPLPENITAVVAVPDKDVMLTLGDDFSLQIPAGAVSEPMVIKTDKTEKNSYAVSPEGVFFNKPIVITLGYNVSSFADAGYENPEEKLSILMDGVGVLSVADTQKKKFTTASLDLATFRVGIVPEYPYQDQDVNESDYEDMERQSSQKTSFKTISYIQSSSDSSSSYDINDKYCQKEDISFDLTRKELEDSDFMRAVNDRLKKSFIDMYIALSEDGKLRNFYDGFRNNSHSIYTCRSGKLAHKYSTGSNVYNYVVKLQRMKIWASWVGIKKDKGDVTDEDGNIWYNLNWPSNVEIMCDFFDFGTSLDQCKENLMTNYIRRKAKSNVKDIVQQNSSGEDIISGAEEGYGDENVSRRLPNVKMRISSHVTGDAVDLAGIKWDSFGGKWSDEAIGFIGKYGLYRPYRAGVTREPNPEGVIGEEHWHFEVSPLIAKVNSVSPNYATIGELTNFTVTGQNLPSTLALSIDGCDNMVALGGTPTSTLVAATSMDFYSASDTFTSRCFSCTPNSSFSGVKSGSVKDTQGGDILYKFNVSFVQDTETPKVTSVSPSKATLDKPTIFTVIGSDLPSTLAFWIADCEDVASLGGSSTSMRFSCTPSWTSGEKNGVVKDEAGGNILYEFHVDFTAPPKVTSITPNSATLDRLTVFTVLGTDLPSTLAFWIEDCENVTYVGGNSAAMQFSCTPSWTIGAKNGVIKDEAGGNVLHEFTIDVSADAPGTCTSGSQTMVWQGLEWQRCDDNWDYAYEAAKDYCEGLELGGYSDWRLPTKEELKSLVVCSDGTQTPLADYPTTPYHCDDDPWTTTIDSSFVGRPTTYWSSTERDANNAWEVGFGNGFAQAVPKAIQSAVRCVR